MAATVGSKYQVIASLHQSASLGDDLDYQRSSENYNSYILRMAGHSFLPDINPTESDADYQNRLGSYLPKTPFDRKGYGWINNTSSPLTTSFNSGSGVLSISRSAAGVYPIIISYPDNVNPFHISYQGYTTTGGNVTASLYYISGPTINGVTMSTFAENSPSTPLDPTSASFVLWN